MLLNTIKDNFDINVYNRGADESTVLPEDEHYDEWVLCAFSIVEEYSGYGTGTFMPELNLVLTEEEAKALTLGWEPELGGDYIGDEDFFLDATTFKQTYKNIPESVSTWIDFVLALL